DQVTPTGEARSYGYDPADRLTGVLYPNGDASLWNVSSDGSRLGERRASNYTGALDGTGYGSVPQPSLDLVYGHDPLTGALASVTESQGRVPTTTYTYDATGRRKQETNGGNSRFYRWDPSNRLIGVDTSPTSPIVRYVYDHEGLRRSRSGTSADASWTWAQGEIVEEQTVTGPNVYETVGDLLVATGNIRTGTDAVGSVVTQTGSVASRFSLDPWGSYLVVTGRFGVPPPSQSSAGFAGTSFEASLGLH